MKIVEQPDIFLREPTSEVKLPLSPQDQDILNAMIDTMYLNKGIGLAANQVGYARRMFVMDTSTDRNSPKFFINPVIKKRAKDLRTIAEIQRKKFLKTQVGTIQNVLVEKNSIGYTPNFTKIKINEVVECSDIISTKILNFNSEGLIGCINESA
jgi:hypothetical protein